MIVRCASCQTEFSLDDRQVGPEGAAVRCSVCGTVFRVEPVEAGADPTWQVRTVDELLFTAPDLATLRAWITEGRLHPDDHVSRTGKHWMRLGDMPEFAEAFAAFQEIPGVLQPVGPGGEASGDLGPPPAFGTADTKSPLTPPVQDPGEPHEPVLEADDVLETDGAPTEGDSPGGQTLARLRLERVATTTGPAAITEIQARGPDPRRASSSSGALPLEVIPSSADLSGPIDLSPPPPPPPSPAKPEPDQAQRSGPSSMLQAVTSHVRPITNPIPSVPASTEQSDASSVVSDRPRRVASGHRDDELEPETLAPARRTGGRKAWPLALGLALLCSAAVVVGVPQVRERMLKLLGEEEPAAPKMYDGPEMMAAAAAMRGGDPQAIGAAEAALQARIDAADLPPDAIAAMKLAQVELLSVRALASAVRAMADEQARAAAQADSREDADRAGRIFDGLDTATIPDRDRVRVARARLRLVQGRPEAEIMALLPESGVEELRALIKAGPLLREPEARVPDGLIAQLGALESPSNLARLVLALAYLRSGDERGAEALVDPVLAEFREQPAALALKVAIDGAQGEAKDPIETEDPQGDGAQGDDEGSEIVEVPPDATDSPGGDGKEGPGSSGPRLNIDALIDRGCNKIESGDTKEGIDLLTQAHDRRPADLDVMICLGEGHRRMGSHSAALKWFEKALGRSSSFPAALRGAARAAAKIGNESKALKYYRRVLDGEPSNAEAREYIDAHEATASAGDPSSGQGG